MKKRFLVISALLAAELLSGCGALGVLYQPALPADRQAQFEADLALCLGDLSDYLSQEDYDRLAEQFLPVWRLREKRLAKGDPTMGFVEHLKFKSFSQALDRCTQEIFGSPLYYYEDSKEYDLADFRVNSDGTLGEAIYYDDWDSYSYTQEEVEELWALAASFLPNDALTVFDTYSVFTDGESNVTAYVYWDFTDEGITWGLALDLADSTDEEYLQETLLHEYCHYLTLNEEQVIFESAKSNETYSEQGLTTRPDSYLNQFYQTWWSPLLKDERTANPDSTDFFQRHYDEFYDDYATTDPCEDIAECFACYVLMSDGWYDDPNLEVWEKKIAWFDRFEEFREIRQEVLSRLTAEAA